MTIANPRIHIICGICGHNKMFQYSISKENNNDTEIILEPIVYITCTNCSSVTALNELIPEENE